MFDLKITLPRLKTYSQRGTIQTFKTVTDCIRTVDVHSNFQKDPTSLQQKLNSLKYQYVNKSPHYFKARNRSYESLAPIKQANQTIEEYVGEQSRVLDREMLLSIARQRIKKLRKKQFTKKKVLNEFQKTTIVQKSMKQSKYQNFRPLRVPLKHCIKYSLDHPDLRVKAVIN